MVAIAASGSASGGGGGNGTSIGSQTVAADGMQSSSMPSTSLAQSGKRSAPPALDALTATLQNSRIADNGKRRHSAVSPATYKRLFLEPRGAKLTTNSDVPEYQHGQRPEAMEDLPPSLSVLLHDRVWAQGGEVVLLLGQRKASDAQLSAQGRTGDVDQMTTPDLEHVDIPFTADEIVVSFANIDEAAAAAECQATVLLHTKDESHGDFAFVMVRRIPSNAQELLELRVAVIGNVDAGKSSTLGVLTRGGLDDGRGKARVNLFRHKHEIESGRTSSVGMEIMGYDSHGKVVMNIDPKNPSDAGRKMSWEEVCEKSAKVISFIDLAGHERYLKTTVGGLTGCLPDFVMLMVGANAGLIGMSKEHLGVALALAVPVLVCITKIDMTPPHILEATIKQLTKILRSPGCRKTPIFVDSLGQAVDSALRLGHERICPVFQISNVTGHNLDLLRSFLNVLPQASPAKVGLGSSVGTMIA